MFAESIAPCGSILLRCRFISLEVKSSEDGGRQGHFAGCHQGCSKGDANFPLPYSTTDKGVKMNQFIQIRSKTIYIVIGLLLFILLLSRVASSAPTSDEFIRGYAMALLQRDFQITEASLKVQYGIIYINGLKASDIDQARIQTSLSSIEGVKQVVVSKDGKLSSNEEKPEITPRVNVFLPRDLLFKPLLADPRWPHFSASYQHYIHNSRLEDVGSATFGESFSIYRFGGPGSSQMEVGIQAGVFSIFDLGAESLDLVNADYFVAVPLSFKKDNFSALARVFHQSSHLGDEYLLRGQTRERINLSYEGLDTILSYNLPLGFRIYGGGGYLFHSDPSSLKPWITQAGLEFRSPYIWWNGSLRPVAAIDIQNREDSNWNTDVSVRAGVQLENPDFLSRKLQILIEYYNGRSPNGQFYIQDIQSVGIGIHFFYD
jgi:hypothetical protein